MTAWTGTRPGRPAFTPSAALLLASGRPGDGEEVMDALTTDHPDLAVVGAVLGAGGWPFTLDGDGRVGRPGVVGVLTGPGVRVEPLVVSLRRPVGPAMVVTGAEGRVVRHLDGDPAWDRLVRMARDEVPADDVALINRELYLGPADDRTAWSDPADPAGTPSVVRVIGRERDDCGLVLGGPVVEEGSVVRFAVGDPAGAAAGRYRALGGRPGSAALTFRAGPPEPAPADRSGPDRPPRGDVPCAAVVAPGPAGNRLRRGLEVSVLFTGADAAEVDS